MLKTKKTQKTLRREDSTKKEVLHLAFELSHNKWKLGFSDGNKPRFKTIFSRDLDRLQEEIEKAKGRFLLKGDMRIVSCYEAGRDGFWFHRYLLRCGICEQKIEGEIHAEHQEFTMGKINDPQHTQDHGQPHSDQRE